MATMRDTLSEISTNGDGYIAESDFGYFIRTLMLPDLDGF